MMSHLFLVGDCEEKLVATSLPWRRFARPSRSDNATSRRNQHMREMPGLVGSFRKSGVGVLTN